MSSTKFNVGLMDGDRTSSRVLKPPGGGHSDIFGPREEEKPRGKGRHQDSEIKGCFTFQEPPKQLPNKEAEKQVNEQKVDENAAPEEKPQPALNQRGRVPPGGFSSGLW